MRRSRNDKTVGGEKAAEDARWTGKGRAREWDRGKWCRRETRSKRWVWRLLGGGKAVGFSTTSGKRWIDRQMDGIAIGLQCYPCRYHGLAMQFCHVELQNRNPAPNNEGFHLKPAKNCSRVSGLPNSRKLLVTVQYLPKLSFAWVRNHSCCPQKKMYT